MGSVLATARRVLARRRAPLACSGCGRPHGDTLRFVAGPGVYLCEVCIRDAMARVADRADAAPEPRTCRFCGQVVPCIVVGGAGEVATCAACTQLMAGMIAEDGRDRRP